jgi:hypothetical protein
MKKIIYLLIFLFSGNILFAQFDKPSFQIGVGLAEPYEQLKGSGYTTSTIYNNIPVTLIDTNLFKTNYGAKTGFSIFGSAKINFDKYDILRGTAFLGYTNFNTFEGSKYGNQIDGYISGPDTVYFAVPIDYSYSFNSFSFGFGLELAPTSFTNVFSPFFAGNVSFNVLSASLNRTKNNRDTVGFSATSFRIGVNLTAGIEAKFSPQFGLAIGYKYDLGNLLLRSSSNSNLADVYEWGASNANLNDDEGPYLSKLPNFLNDGWARMYSGQKKNINWGTFYIAVNFYPNMNAPKQDPKKK